MVVEEWVSEVGCSDGEKSEVRRWGVWSSALKLSVRGQRALKMTVGGRKGVEMGKGVEGGCRGSIGKHIEVKQTKRENIERRSDIEYANLYGLNNHQ